MKVVNLFSRSPILLMVSNNGDPLNYIKIFKQVMKTNILKYIGILIVSFWKQSPYQAIAQQTKDLGDENVIVVKAYQPTLMDAYKISDVPAKDSIEAAIAPLKYDVDIRKFNTEYKPSPIKPVKIKDDTIKKLYRGYVKAGYGNYNTYYGEVFYNALRSKEIDAGVHFRHQSATGKLKGYGYPGWSDNLLELFGKKFLASSTLDAMFSFQRQVSHFYGYDSPPNIFSKAETKHRFSDFNGSISYGSNYKSASERLDYNAVITYNSFADNYENAEGTFSIHGFAGKDFNGHYGKLGVMVNFSEYTQPVLGKVNTTFLSFQPRYAFNRDLINLEAGGNVEVEFEDATSFHLFPYLKAKYQLIDDAFSVYAELKGNIQQNYFRSLSLENPFLASNPQIKNTNNKLDIGAGLNARLDHDIKAGLSASYQRKLNEPFFVNIDNINYPVNFKVEYYDVNVLNIHAEVSYEHIKKLDLALKADYQKFGNNNSDRFWYKPAVKITFSGNYHIADKINIKTDWFYNSSVYAKSFDAKGYSTLKGWLDLNLGGEYIYKKNLSIFLKMNNIASVRYKTWYQYPSYRFNVMGGLTYSF